MKAPFTLSLLAMIFSASFAYANFFRTVTCQDLLHGELLTAEDRTRVIGEDPTFAAFIKVRRAQVEALALAMHVDLSRMQVVAGPDLESRFLRSKKTVTVSTRENIGLGYGNAREAGVGFVLQHEMAHAIFNQAITAHSHLWNSLLKSEDTYRDAADRVSNEVAASTRKFNAESDPELKATLKLELEKVKRSQNVLIQRRNRELQALTYACAYDEVFADLVPSLLNHDLLYGLKVFGSALDGEDKQIIQWRGFRAKKFSADDYDRWKSFLHKHQGGPPTHYELLAPARSELARFISEQREQVPADFLNQLLKVFGEEIDLQIGNFLDSGQPLDPDLLNSALVEKLDSTF